jgi:type IX secretion system PorP/SprF family membrane protein
MNKMLTKYLLLLATCFLFGEGISQDIQFSQFYAVPMYQNPAFAGSAHRTRGILHQRLQWPKLGSKFITSLASIDHYSSKYKSGFGLMVTRDIQGANTISSWDVAFSYSYEVHLSSKLTFRPGLTASLVNRNINYASLRFPSQFNDTTGYLSGSVSPLGNGDQNRMYPDIGTGGIFYTDKFWIGLSAHHINLPNQSFLGQVSRVPLKGSVTGGYRFTLEEKRSGAYLEAGKEISITPTFHYKFQGKSDQLDIGVYGIYDVLMIGFWFRGLPVVKEYRDKIQNTESMIFLVGYKVKNYSISYSYDRTTSRLASSGTGGSHEINLTYYHHKVHKKKKPMKRLPCPSFYKH